jgi:hypothetical protein
VARLEVHNAELGTWDTIKCRLGLWPDFESHSAAAQTLEGAPADDSAPIELPRHRVAVQIIGGHLSSQIYVLSCHSVEPSYQVHVSIPDHRIAVHWSQDAFHRHHPLMASLEKQASIRMLLRIRPDGSGPLVGMCGCC